MNQPFEHNADHGHIHKGLTRLGQSLVIAAALCAGGCNGSHLPVIWGVNNGPIQLDAVKYDANPQYATYSVRFDLTPQPAPQQLPNFTDEDVRLAQSRTSAGSMLTAHAD